MICTRCNTKPKMLPYGKMGCECTILPMGGPMPQYWKEEFRNYLEER